MAIVYVCIINSNNNKRQGKTEFPFKYHGLKGIPSLEKQTVDKTI